MSREPSRPVNWAKAMAKHLIPTRKLTHPVVPPVTLDALVELVAADDWAKTVFSAMQYPGV